MPIPARLSQMKVEDFIGTLDVIQSQIPSPLFVSLWTWEKMEPDEGQSRIKKEVEGLNYAVRRGYRPYIGLTVIDTVKRVLPDDLQKVSWRDPILIERYRARVEELAKYAPAQAGYFVIANEADVYFETYPDEAEDFCFFVTQAMQEVRRYFPTAKIGVSVTYEGIFKGGARKEFASRMIALSDRAFLTYYPVSDMRLTLPADTPAQLDQMIAVAGDKNIVLQEIGYASGVPGSSPQIQADFFATIIPAIDARPQIEVAAIFALHDFDGPTCEGLVGYYGFSEAAETDWVKFFRSYICTLGLFDATGQPKPAWQAVTAAYGKRKPR